VTSDLVDSYATISKHGGFHKTFLFFSSSLKVLSTFLETLPDTMYSAITTLPRRTPCRMTVEVKKTLFQEYGTGPEGPA